ncbi:SH3 domain-containing protein [Litoreibacter roseus]|uniref:SH3-like domain-containing protein n=1 Tax=Litoreibacter roseus TaxID=2601869 RepID=A0A6N6JBJ5_9RHOB|nr:SH3 domain-containing protein [Litoreibacter roseus]GFE63367.1 hypothetical protein KIN_04410 [Litoreibacter roseus]
MIRHAVFAIAASFAFCAPAWAADRGPVTNLPMPRYVSLKAAEGNVRRGPSLSHRIDWVFKHRNMPLQIVAEHGHWRRVVDSEGAGGWVHYSLLSGSRFVRVEEDLAPLYRKADPSSDPVAYAEAGVIARLGSCETSLCKITVNGTRGWVARDQVWGILPDEVRD